jgi:SAM-dependent methyltransferase
MNATRSPMSVIWHDLECGSYDEDLPLWRSLAAEYGDPVLEVGAGTGRVALHLVERGFRVVALDHDPELLSELARRVRRPEAVTTISADARNFELSVRFPLCIVPMQTIQLLHGTGERAQLLGCVRRHLLDGGAVAVAITEAVELYDADDGSPVPLPDVRELGGVIYSSQPTAVRADRRGFELERRRETITVDGRCIVEQDIIHLAPLTPAQLELEGRAAGLQPAGRMTIPATSDHVGSEVVILRA